MTTTIQLNLNVIFFADFRVFSNSSGGNSDSWSIMLLQWKIGVGAGRVKSRCIGSCREIYSNAFTEGTCHRCKRSYSSHWQWYVTYLLLLVLMTSETECFSVECVYLQESYA